MTPPLRRRSRPGPAAGLGGLRSIEQSVRTGTDEQPAAGVASSLDCLARDPDQIAALSPEVVPALLVQCTALQSALLGRLLGGTAGLPRRNPNLPSITAAVPEGIDNQLPREYLSIRELAERIPYSEGTLRNLMSQGRLRLGEHYVKPKGRVMFKWSAVRDWLNAGPGAPG